MLNIFDDFDLDIQKVNGLLIDDINDVGFGNIRCFSVGNQGCLDTFGSKCPAR